MPRSIQQKSVYRKGDFQRRSHSVQQKVGAAVRLSQEPSQQREREREVGHEVLPRTTTTSVVLASADHAVVESRRREDMTVFSER